MNTPGGDRGSLVWAVAPTLRQAHRVQVSHLCNQGVKDNMFPTNIERKRLTGLSQQGRNMEGAWGGPLENKNSRKMTFFFTVSTESISNAPKFSFSESFLREKEKHGKIPFFPFSVCLSQFSFKQNTIKVQCKIITQFSKLYWHDYNCTFVLSK